MFEPWNEPDVWQPDEDLELERLLRAASDYVRPADQLRPKVVEALGEELGRRRAWRPMLRRCALTVAAMITLLACSQMLVYVTPHGVSSKQIQEQAVERSLNQGISWEWAISEVVDDWRSGGRANFNPPSPDSRDTNQYGWGQGVEL